MLLVLNHQFYKWMFFVVFVVAYGHLTTTTFKIYVIKFRWSPTVPFFKFKKKSTKPIYENWYEKVLKLLWLLIFFLVVGGSKNIVWTHWLLGWMQNQMYFFFIFDLNHIDNSKYYIGIIDATILLCKNGTRLGLKRVQWPEND